MRLEGQRFYRPELDGLRFFAFFFVFLSHALPSDADYYVRLGFSPGAAGWIITSLSIGGAGVDLFFVLSSYLITELLIREHERRRRIDVSSFYIRRILRIWPLYFVFLLFAYLIAPKFLPWEHLHWKYLLAFMLLVGNWACVWRGYPQSVITPLWSVSVEEQFYLTWPLLLRVLGVRRIVPLACAMIGIAAVTRLVLVSRDSPYIVYWCNTFVRLDSIASGALLAVLLRGAAPQIGRLWRYAMCISGLLCWVLVAHYNIPRVGALYFYPALAVGSVLLLLGSLSDRASLLKHPVLVRLGQISYGLYVFHMLCIWTVLRLGLNKPLTALLSLSFTILLALASYRWLETPFLRLKERFTHIKSRPPTPALN